MNKRLYKRNAKGKPIVWSADKDGDQLIVEYGLVGTNLHREVINITLKKANELESRIKAKRKEGYKELKELKDSSSVDLNLDKIDLFASKYNNPEALKNLINYLDTYLPKYSTTSEGFVLPMLAKVLKDNKPFEKLGTLTGQFKINGLRCIVGAKKNAMDLFNPITLTYHSREGEDWTPKMAWMDAILLPCISAELTDMMIEEQVCLDGELYLPGYSVNDVNSFVKNTSLPQHYKLQYWCYDICIENMSSEYRSFTRCREIFADKFTPFDRQTHLNNTKQFILLEDVPIDSFAKAVTYRDKFINLGFEGLILRNPKAEYAFGKRNSSMFKFKKKDDGLFEIVDIKEDKRGLPIYTLKNDINNEYFECTINLSQDAQRNQLAMKSFLIGKKGLVEYRERSGVTQVPFHAKLIKIYV